MTTVPTAQARFPRPAMAALVDVPVRYDLAASTCPPLSLGELLDADTLARLHRLPLGYGTIRGDADLRALIAAGSAVDPEDVLVNTGGSSSAMFLLAFVLCRPGDHAVVTTPCFPPTRAVPEALDVRLTPVALSFDDGYRLDVDAVAAALTPSTRLVSLASPQNPSGIRFTELELRALLDRVEAVAPQAVVLVDETYREATYGDDPVPPPAAALSPRVVTCSSLSKSHGAPGLRVGWLTVTDPALREQLRDAKFNSFITGSEVDELLATEILRDPGKVLAPRRASMAARLDVLCRWAEANSGDVELLRPDGGAICCVRLRADRFDDAAVARFHRSLAERDTRVARGSWFGESDRVFRVGFGCLPDETYKAALDRVADVLSAR